LFSRLSFHFQKEKYLLLLAIQNKNKLKTFLYEIAHFTIHSIYGFDG